MQECEIKANWQNKLYNLEITHLFYKCALFLNSQLLVPLEAE